MTLKILLPLLLVAVLGRRAARWRPTKLRLSIATGGTGGVYYPYGGGLARLLSAHVPGMQVTAEVTGGSVDNVKLVGAGDADIGFSTIDSAVDAVKGVGAYKDTGRAEDSGDRRALRQLRACRRAGGREDRDGGADEGQAHFGGLGGVEHGGDCRSHSRSGRSEADEGRHARQSERGGIGGGAERRQDRRDVLDRRLADVGDHRFGDDGQHEGRVRADRRICCAKLNAKYPGLYRSFTMPKTVYAGTPADVPGLGVSNIMFVGADMKAATVEKILKGIFDNLAEAQKIHPDAKTLTLAGARRRRRIAVSSGGDGVL